MSRQVLVSLTQLQERFYEVLTISGTSTSDLALDMIENELEWVHEHGTRE
jgi:hypothetical protein